MSRLKAGGAFWVAMGMTLLVLVLDFVSLRYRIQFLQGLDLKLYDLRLAVRGRVPVGDAVAIAAIDEKSVHALGRWPWPRTRIAELVRRLGRAGAKAIALDIVFSEPDRNANLLGVRELRKSFQDLVPAEAFRKHEEGTRGKFLERLDRAEAEADTDRSLAKAFRETPGVVQGFFFYMPGEAVATPSPATAFAGARLSVLQGGGGNLREQHLLEGIGADANIPLLAASAPRAGYFNARPDPDGTIRQSPLVLRYGDDLYGSLALEAVAAARGEEPLVRTGELGIEEVTLGGLTIPVDRSGTLLINYCGPKQTFPHYGISDILAGKVPDEKFRGKIVFVGATAIGIYDLRVTPLDHVYPGVEIHANVADQILRSRYLYPVDPSLAPILDLALLLGLGLLLGVWLPRLRALRGEALALGLAVAYLAGIQWAYDRHGWVLPALYPLLEILAVSFGVTVFKYATEERSRRQTREAFQRYVSPEVVNEILRDPGRLQLGGIKKDLTVLFSDIRGFTSISEGLTPEQVASILNEYLTPMTEIVFRNGGTLDKYIGDAVMAVFGAPLDQPDHPRRCARAALEMMRDLRGLQAGWAAQGLPRLDIGIGVNSGPMAVGNMGSKMFFDYTVIGDNVNLASRLEGLNKMFGTHIIISESTRAALGPEFLVRELDSVRVKGKEVPVRIHELLALRGEEGESDPRELALAYEEALGAYRKRSWARTIELLEAFLRRWPQDRPALLLLERTRTLAASPPDEAWEGVTVLTEK